MKSMANFASLYVMITLVLCEQASEWTSLGLLPQHHLVLYISTYWVLSYSIAVLYIAQFKSFVQSVVQQIPNTNYV